MGRWLYIAAAALLLAGCGARENGPSVSGNESTVQAGQGWKDESAGTGETAEENAGAEEAFRENAGETVSYEREGSFLMLDGRPFTVDEDQSFDTELNRFGAVRFITAVPGQPEEDVEFLLEKDGELSYRFPHFPQADAGPERGAFLQVNAVSFCDVNGDGKQDVIALTAYEKRGQTDLYLGTERGFVPDYTAAVLADDAGAGNTVEEFRKYDEKRRRENEKRMEQVLGFDEAAVRDFAGQFIACAEAGETERAASMIQYPVTVRTASGEFTANKEEDLLPCFDQIFDEEFMARLKDDMSLIGWDETGAFLGDGSLWLAKRGSRMAVISAGTEEESVRPAGGISPSVRQGSGGHEESFGIAGKTVDGRKDL